MRVLKLPSSNFGAKLSSFQDMHTSKNCILCKNCDDQKDFVIFIKIVFSDLECPLITRKFDHENKAWRSSFDYIEMCFTWSEHVYMLTIDSVYSEA